MCCTQISFVGLHTLLQDPKNAIYSKCGHRMIEIGVKQDHSTNHAVTHVLSTPALKRYVVISSWLPDTNRSLRHHTSGKKR